MSKDRKHIAGGDKDNQMFWVKLQLLYLSFLFKNCKPKKS